MTTGTPSPHSSPGHLPADSHLTAGRESGLATFVPSHDGAHLTNKGANSASWPHDMDTYPQGIGSKIGDFHKGQPTAGRQELPGHCHLGLNWNMPTRHKGCVCNHSIAPSQGLCFQLQGLCSGRGTRLKVPFIVVSPPTLFFFSSALPSACQCRKGFPAPRLVIANEKVHRKSIPGQWVQRWSCNQKPCQTSPPGLTPKPPRISCHMRLV